MAQHAAPSTLETTVNNLTNQCEDGHDNQPPDAYTPVFNKQVRTVVYRAWLGRLVRRPLAVHDLW